ncbi:MAG TPA: 1-acyl-sn-glycerol-3-phosphate acyltransferase [Ghiorsea sp.]|nr:1-acyl-sn-glycerol-3-phosphate acyltransferase [Ghiorsea sp.]HIP07953.1 1-acyl-sn-glycerol-3-phosphate acyltransferase [Mariprofundaceae bacterium]
MKHLQAWLFYGLYTTLTITIAVLVIIARVFGRNAAWQVGKLWGLTGNALLFVICGIRVKIEGQENIPDAPCVYAVKHQSTWETTTIPLALPPFAWILKKELMLIPFFGWALYTLGAIAINRSNPRDALKQVNNKGVAQIQSGRSVVIFPEGTRAAVGEAGQYKPGVILLAKKAKVPIVPVAHNAGLCWPKGTVIKHSGTITLRILPPISAEDVQTKKRNDVLQDIETRIETACRELGA